MSPESQPRTYYAIWLILLGFILGLPFIFLGTAIAILLAALPATVDSVILVQTSQPLLWIIDTIPFLLAFSLGMLGGQLGASQRLRWQASRAIKAREAEIERLNREIAPREAARKQLDDVIGRGKRDWEATFDALEDMILITDSGGMVLRCNRATSQAFQQGFEEIVGKQIESLFFGSPEGGSFPIPAHKTEMKFPKLEGRYEVSSSPLTTEEGQAATLYTMRRITDHQQTIRDLSRQNEYYQALVRSTPFAIVTLNMEGRIVACNPAFEKLFGYSEKEVLGREIDPLVAPAELSDEGRALTQSVMRGEVVHAVTRRRKKGADPGGTGELFDAEVYGIPVVLRGKQIGILALYHDITHLLSGASHPQAAVAIPTEEVESTMEPPPPEGVPAVLTAAPAIEASEPAAEPENLITALTPESGARSSSTSAPAEHGQMTPITAIVGIGSDDAARLGDQGIHSVEDLLRAGATLENQQTLAEETGLPPKLIQRWVALAGLIRVPGLGKEFLPLLEAAGVETVSDLRARHPQSLFAELQQVNAEKNLVERAPLLNEVEAWIAATKEMGDLV